MTRGPGEELGAVRAVPAAMGSRIETTTVDGYGHAVLVCAVCAWYGDHVCGRIGGGIALVGGGRLWRRADLPALSAAAAAHRCPPEVLDACAAARALPSAAARWPEPFTEHDLDQEPGGEGR